MERAPTALHRVAAWCAAALCFALVLVGTRTVLRALHPKPEPEPSSSERVETMLDDVAVERGAAAPERAATDEAEPPVDSPRNARRAAWAPGDEPMERHAACVIEGTVRSVSGLLQQPVDLNAIASAVATPEQGAEVYLASRLAMDPDHPAERAYLDALAGRLKLPAELRKHLEASVVSEQ